MLVAFTFFLFLMHQKYNVIQGMQVIYCNFFFIISSSFGYSVKTTREHPMCYKKKNKMPKKDNVYSQPACDRITFETKGVM